MFPLINLPPFAWDQHDEFLVGKQRALETALRESPMHVSYGDHHEDIRRYSDRYREQRSTTVLPSDFLGERLHSKLYPLELARPPWAPKPVTKGGASAAAASVPTRPAKLRRRNSYDEELTVLEQGEKQAAAGEGGGDMLADEVALLDRDNVEDFADEDDNDYVVNYYDSDEDGGGPTGRGEATFS